MAKTLHYNFLTNPTLTGSSHPVAASPDLSITRATKATMTDADGYIREVQAGEARFTGATFAHNLLWPSQDVDARWTTFQSVIASNAGTAPDGTTTASSITVDNGGGTGDPLTDNTAIVVRAGNSITFSVYMKANGGDWVLLSTNGLAGGDATLYANLSAGTLGGTANTTATSITAAANGFYRVSITFDMGTDTNCNLRIRGAVANGDLTVPRDGVWSVLFWGAQAEIDGNRTTPGTYVATTTAAASSLTGTSTKGLLVEEARTNLLTYSETFDPASGDWTENGISMTDNAATSPDGATTAASVVAASGAASQKYIENANYTLTGAHTVSVFAKAGNKTIFRIRSTDIGVVDADVWFNLSTVAVGTKDAEVTASGIDDYGNGWYRCWVVFSSDSDRTRVSFADSDGSLNLSGDASTVNGYIWGGQVESGSFPTSYIPTTTGSVTRNVDDISTTDVSWYTNGTASTLYAAVRPGQVLDTTTRYPIFLSKASDLSATWEFRRDTGTGVRFRYKTSNTEQFSIVKATIFAADTLSRMVSTADTNDAIGYADGSATGTDATVTLHSTVDTLNIGREPFGSGNWNGHIAEIAHFNERLVNATLADYSLNGLPTAFPGTVAGDGGHIWPPRANDPRWTQIITDSGITASGNFIDDCHAALEALASTTGAMDDLWKKFKAVYSVTDTSEPFSY